MGNGLDSNWDYWDTWMCFKPLRAAQGLSLKNGLLEKSSFETEQNSLCLGFLCYILFSVFGQSDLLPVLP